MIRETMRDWSLASSVQLGSHRVVASGSIDSGDKISSARYMIQRHDVLICRDPQGRSSPIPGACAMACARSKR